ncbi:carboxymuconolactone decarboxylase family protein [Candidatus Mycobacterium wuenschmannii]|uniref:Carboxymuconolactone decarboxylase family protein n=1 Tax=Candidatus Mycobacterium wuenschmannii TaxID=3027808 RepID=A0ABY8VWM1_9MYCO|nr:carboxymuconolactone decarboxylase family protein [Candidatus Mycobacterium wuenschmannii]WIM88040.1 carboxymuconolactone decarboxylase family protein [Candidatus Mycobacterium wuenschmannii]
MSRIPMVVVDEQPEPIRDFMRRRGTPDIYRVLANAPAVFAGWAQLVDELVDSPTFSDRMRQLVAGRVAHEADPADLTTDERLLLDVVTELCTTHRLRDESFTAAHELLGDERLTELLMLVSYYFGLTLVSDAVDAR